jgi:cation:H+ antiporter
MSPLIVWGKFLLLLLLVYIFGSRAAKSADVIAEKKGLAKAFMGVVFISMITSFPELFTGISAGAIVKAPDIAVGQIVGSCVFNLLIIGIIEIFFRKKNIYGLTGRIDIMPLAFSLMIIAVLTLFLSIQFNFSIFHVGASSIIIIALYFLFMWAVFKERKTTQQEEEQYKNKSLPKEIAIFIFSSLVIIGVGIFLPIVGKELAGIMNWTDSFVGVIFLALVTSFPEFVVSFSLARMGSIDMLLGNITGSNMFNIGIIFVIDLVYVKGNVLAAASPENVPVGLIAVLMNFVIFFAVVRHSTYRLFNIISINGIILIVLYIINLLVIY